MKTSYLLALGIALGAYSQINIAGEIADTYTTGDTLTATKLDNIKSAVNDNDTRMRGVELINTLQDGDIQRVDATSFSNENIIRSRAVLNTSTSPSEALGIIRGCIDPIGVPSLPGQFYAPNCGGAGFMWEKVSNGRVRVQFTTNNNFTGTPVITANAISTNGGGTGVYASVSGLLNGTYPDATGFQVETYDTCCVDGAMANRAFSFIAIGPRVLSP